MPKSEGPAQRRAIIIGGSMAGLFAANLLRRDGWRVDVYERVGEALTGRGAGIVTYPELLQMLSRAGAKVDSSIGVEVSYRVVLDPAGHVIGKRHMPQIMTSWGRLRRSLLEALPAQCYHAGKALIAVEQDAHGITAMLDDGDRVEGDLLVGADGFRSTVRGIFAPEVRPLYAGYVAWRLMLEEAALAPETHAALFDKFAFCLPPGEQILGYPVAGANDDVAVGRRRYNIVWYRPAEEDNALRRLLTDDSGRYHQDGIPPHLVSLAVVRGMREAAQRVVAPQFAEMVRAAEQPMLQPIYDLEPSRVVFGRAVMVGDAAFVARPHCGMGVTKAGMDAMALADALADRARPLAAGLAQFEHACLRFGKMAVAHSRRLGAPLQTVLVTDEERTMAKRYRDPDALLRDTAVMLHSAEA